MRVKQRLQINTVVSVISVFSVLLALGLGLYRVNNSVNTSELADQIISGAFERVSFRNDYVQTNSERAKEQWRAKHAQVGRLIRSAFGHFPNDEDKKLLAELLENQESIGKTFRAIVENRENTGLEGRDALLSREIEDRLVGQLNMRVYEAVQLGGMLQDSGRASLISGLWLAAGGMLFVLVLVGAATLLNSWSMGRAISDRILRLRHGVSVIGEGNLGHRIDVKGDDEFAELSDAFNAMTARLSDSHRDLENQIEVRKGTEAKLRESGARLDLALQSAQMGVWHWDIIQDRRYFDDQVCRLLGIDASTFTGTTKEFFDVVHPDDREGLQTALSRTIDEDLLYEPEYRVVWPGGTIRHIAARGRLTRNEAGRPARVNGVVWDITESKRMQEAVLEAQRQNEFLASIVELAAQPFGVGYPDGSLGFINRAFEELTGYTSDELRSIDWATVLTPPEWFETEREKLEELHRTGRPVRYEKEYIRKDGTRVPIELLVHLRTDKEGKPQYYYSFLNDITERKRAEDALRLFTTELQAANAELRASRSAALNLMEDAENARKSAEETSVQLRREIAERKRFEQALQKAHDELANQVEERTRELREKEVLLKEVHHRVKNNLQVISSLVSLQAEGTQESVREVLRDVTYRVRSMALVHEKLYQSSDLASIDFAEYARGLLGYLWRAHGPAAACLRLTLDLKPVSLPVDIAVPCGLILNELAGNALKHAFRGRAEGEVAVSLQRPVAGCVSLCVRDNGTGLPDGFDWRQARSLGLRLVQMLAGQIHGVVEATCRGGTEFTITFGGPKT